MADLVQSNMALVVALLLVLAVLALWLVLANRRTRIALGTGDDGAPARRNQALIDAVPHAEVGVVPLMEPDATVVLAEPAGADDLLLIKGLGPRLKTQMAELGVTTFAQIAAWSDADIDRIDAQLGRFQGRIRRENWVEQAKLLAAGDAAGFAERFGNNG